MLKEKVGKPIAAPEGRWAPVGRQGLIAPTSDNLLTVNSSPLLVPNRERLLRTRLDVVNFPETPFLEIHRINPYVMAVDLRPALDAHRPLWRSELTSIAKEAEPKPIVGGTIDTSMAPSDHVTYYQPTGGVKIKEELPWFYNLFRNDIRLLATKITGDPSLYLGEDLASSLNINLLREGDYELHTDRDPLTAVLGLRTLEHGEGGDLVLYERRNRLTNSPEGKSFALKPIAGIVYFFNGRKHPHEVTELTTEKPRLVAAGDFYSDAIPEEIDPEFNRKIGVGTAA
jgi:hypothetical protein